MTLFTKLGLVVHPEKCVLNPTQNIIFGGFQLNSTSMTISLTMEKARKVKCTCATLLNKSSPTIREMPQVLGLLTSSMPGVMYGAVRYRSLDMNKTMALQCTQGNYDKPMHLPSCA